MKKTKRNLIYFVALFLAISMVFTESMVLAEVLIYKDEDMDMEEVEEEEKKKDEDKTKNYEEKIDEIEVEREEEKSQDKTNESSKEEEIEEHNDIDLIKEKKDDNTEDEDLETEEDQEEIDEEGKEEPVSRLNMNDWRLEWTDVPNYDASDLGEVYENGHLIGYEIISNKTINIDTSANTREYIQIDETYLKDEDFPEQWQKDLYRYIYRLPNYHNDLPIVGIDSRITIGTNDYIGNLLQIPETYKYLGPNGQFDGYHVGKKTSAVHLMRPSNTSTSPFTFYSDGTLNVDRMKIATLKSNNRDIKFEHMSKRGEKDSNKRVKVGFPRWSGYNNPDHGLDIDGGSIDFSNLSGLYLPMYMRKIRIDNLEEFKLITGEELDQNNQLGKLGPRSYIRQSGGYIMYMNEISFRGLGDGRGIKGDFILKSANSNYQPDKYQRMLYLKDIKFPKTIGGDFNISGTPIHSTRANTNVVLPDLAKNINIGGSGVYQTNDDISDVYNPKYFKNRDEEFGYSLGNGNSIMFTNSTGRPELSNKAGNLNLGIKALEDTSNTSSSSRFDIKDVRGNLSIGENLTNNRTDSYLRVNSISDIEKDVLLIGSRIPVRENKFTIDRVGGDLYMINGQAGLMNGYNWKESPFSSESDYLGNAGVFQGRDMETLELKDIGSKSSPSNIEYQTIDKDMYNEGDESSSIKKLELNNIIGVLKPAKVYDIETNEVNIKEKRTMMNGYKARRASGIDIGVSDLTGDFLIEDFYSIARNGINTLDINGTKKGSKLSIDNDHAKHYEEHKSQANYITEKPLKVTSSDNEGDIVIKRNAFQNKNVKTLDLKTKGRVIIEDGAFEVFRDFDDMDTMDVNIEADGGIFIGEVAFKGRNINTLSLISKDKDMDIKNLKENLLPKQVLELENLDQINLFIFKNAFDGIRFTDNEVEIKSDRGSYFGEKSFYNTNISEFYHMQEILIDAKSRYVGKEVFSGTNKDVDINKTGNVLVLKPTLRVSSLKGIDIFGTGNKTNIKHVEVHTREYDDDKELDIQAFLNGKMPQINIKKLVVYEKDLEIKGLDYVNMFSTDKLEIVGIKGPGSMEQDKEKKKSVFWKSVEDLAEGQNNKFDLKQIFEIERTVSNGNKIYKDESEVVDLNSGDMFNYKLHLKVKYNDYYKKNDGTYTRYGINRPVILEIEDMHERIEIVKVKDGIGTYAKGPNGGFNTSSNYLTKNAGEKYNYSNDYKIKDGTNTTETILDIKLKDELDIINQGDYDYKVFKRYDIGHSYGYIRELSYDSVEERYYIKGAESIVDPGLEDIKRIEEITSNKLVITPGRTFLNIKQKDIKSDKLLNQTTQEVEYGREFNIEDTDVTEISGYTLVTKPISEVDTNDLVYYYKERPTLPYTIFQMEYSIKYVYEVEDKDGQLVEVEFKDREVGRQRKNSNYYFKKYPKGKERFEEYDDGNLKSIYMIDENKSSDLSIYLDESQATIREGDPTFYHTLYYKRLDMEEKDKMMDYEIRYKYKDLESGRYKKLAERIIGQAPVGYELNPRLYMSGIRVNEDYYLPKTIPEFIIDEDENKNIFTIKYEKYITKNSDGGGKISGGGSKEIDKSVEDDKSELDIDKVENNINKSSSHQRGIKSLPKIKENTEEIKYITGYEDGTIRPEEKVSREEVATVAYRLLDDKYKEDIDTDGYEFKDVEKGCWSEKFIRTLVKAEILEGFKDGNFKPTKEMTRGELAVIISRLMDLEGKEENNFTDMDGYWGKDIINGVADEGWINGYEDGSFKPNKKVIRAEMITMINRMLGKNEMSDDNLEIDFKDLSDDKWYYKEIKKAI